MFSRRPDPGAATLRLSVDGVAVQARPGDSVAAAMLAADIVACRDTAISGTARAPYCMMGVCFDCLVNIDGVPNRQACLVPVRDGMQVLRQRGAREAG